ncbi:acyl-CoA N-acyltransferase [Boletus edulis]|nr:acyl-CoA N-acyltransferase [Boletus edulis]
MTTGDPAPHRDGPQFKTCLRTQMENAVFSAIVRCRSTGAFIGQVVLHVPERRNRDGTYGVCLLPAFWNRGYGSEVTAFVVDYAFRWIGLQRLSLSVFACNERAVTVYEKAGFVIEGRKRASVWSNDRWEDVLFMGILRDEWIERISILEQ